MQLLQLLSTAKIAQCLRWIAKQSLKIERIYFGIAVWDCHFKSPSDTFKVIEIRAQPHIVYKRNMVYLRKHVDTTENNQQH